MGHRNARKDTLVIGVGNRFRGDDAAGPSVVDSLRSRIPPKVRIVEHSGEGASLMDLWQPGDTVFLVDAADSGQEAGFIHEFNAREQQIPSEFFRYSTHAFSVAEAIELARVLGCLPARLHVYAIEGRDFGAGHTMSHPVFQSVDLVSDAILARIVESESREESKIGQCTN